MERAVLQPQFPTEVTLNTMIFTRKALQPGKVLPLYFAHRPNCALQRTLTRSFASATPCGRR